MRREIRGWKLCAFVSTVDHTRVILKEADPNVSGSDYINANYVSGEVPGSERRYIATQVGCAALCVTVFETSKAAVFT